MNHFTWWGLASYLIFGVFDLCHRGELWHGVALTVSGIILVGVLGLSACGCTMLATTLADLGPSAFILGNFAVHFYPMLRLLFWAKFKERPDVANFTAQSVYGLSLLVVYMAVARTEEVYGCAVSSLPIFLASLGTLPVVYILAKVRRCAYLTYNPSSPHT
eukprot:gene20283-21158_t